MKIKTYKPEFNSKQMLTQLDYFIKRNMAQTATIIFNKLVENGLEEEAIEVVQANLKSN